MQRVLLCILSGKQFKAPFEDPQWRKVKPMHPLGQTFNGTYEDRQWVKVKATQPVGLRIL